MGRPNPVLGSHDFEEEANPFPHDNVRPEFQLQHSFITFRQIQSRSKRERERERERDVWKVSSEC